jgi:hypothetical protein
MWIRIPHLPQCGSGYNFVKTLEEKILPFFVPMSVVDPWHFGTDPDAEFGSSDPYLCLTDPSANPGGPKTDGSGCGSGTLVKHRKEVKKPVLRIRDVYPGSDFFPSRSPDPNCLYPGSRIRIKEFKCFNPKKWFLSSRKYDPGCSSRIPDTDADFYSSRIPDPGVKKAPDPGSGSATLQKTAEIKAFLTILIF